MEDFLQIYPDELFVLGRIMQAKYIDYDYIRMLSGFQKGFSLEENEIKAEMIKKGFFREDFFGNVELDEYVRAIVMPVFFGEFESEVILIENHDRKSYEQYKFHFYNGHVAQVQIRNDVLYISGCGDKGLELLERKVIDSGYTGSHKKLDLREIDRYTAERYLMIKNMRIGKKKIHSQLMEMDKIWYIGRSEDSVQGMMKDELNEWWNRIVKEE